ncbi:hypothetical protein DL98DRAFT_647344 [Cadophora sp. DSE1049]|nr:hypothetical protein DL98DRAFT_647344 [Cadophora sp. DSE1049]
MPRHFFSREPQQVESAAELLPSEQMQEPKLVPRSYTAGSAGLSSLGSTPTRADTFSNDELKHSSSIGAPGTLHQRTGIQIIWLVWDVILCCVPLSFLVLAGMTSALSGQQVSERGHRIIQWSLLGPTIFPIFFAAIIGRTMKFVAQYKLERGASVDTLERLIGSQSVFAAFMTQAVLAKLGPLSLGILFLWAFSPLGGQASLRIVRTEYNNIANSGQLAYLNMTRQYSSFAAGYSASDSQYSVNALYTGCLIGTGSTKNGSQDSWGNIKIPMLESLGSMVGQEGWIDVPGNHTTYSSMLGIPVSGIPRDRNSSFNLQSYYHHLQCSSKDVISASGDWLTPLQIPWTSQYNTSSIWGMPKYVSFYLGSYTNAAGSRINGTDTSPMELVLLSRSGSDLNTPQNITNITMIKCSMTPTFVETSIKCQGRDCRVDRIRDSTAPHPPSVPLSQGISQIWTLFSTGLAEASGVTSVFSTPTEHYISGQTDFPFANGMEMVSLYNTSLTELSTNLAQVINTYWLASLSPWASTNNLPDDPSDLTAGNSTILANFFPFSANGTNMTTSYLEEVYSCNRGWLGALIVSSLLLFVAGVVGTTLKYMSIGPDVLGYVSTLVAHDPYTFEASQRGNTAMDGLERARYMHGIQIRLEDVREREQVGHIAVATVSGRGDSARKLKIGRIYS